MIKDIIKFWKIITKNEEIIDGVVKNSEYTELMKIMFESLKFISKSN
jgi:hypothetical protein